MDPMYFIGIPINVLAACLNYYQGQLPDRTDSQRFYSGVFAGMSTCCVILLTISALKG